MNPAAPWSRTLREAARNVPLEQPGQRERAWRNLQRARRRPPLLWVALATTAAAAIALFPRNHVAAPVALKAQAQVAQAASMKVDAQSGSVVAEVRDESIVLLGGKGPVRIARREEPVAAGDAALERRAHEEERAGHFAEAAEIYAQVAAQRTPRAATALYELGRLQLRSLHDPQRALESLHRYPGGPLAEDVALTAIEARMALKDDAASLREIDAFLQAFPQSDRAEEVRALRDSLTR